MSALTLGSAFSFSISDALVCWTAAGVLLVRAVRAGERRRAFSDDRRLRRAGVQRRTQRRHALKTCARPISMCFISCAHAAATRCVRRWQPRLAGGSVIWN